ncbi:UNVERIFIED_CONTAM: hypothetical protein K2H54_054451 [Gekko kuhli]
MAEAAASEEPPGLTETARDALRRLGRALGCSRCHNLLEKPVNLGNCEHVFCLACVGDCVGTACPVCHIPSMVQDVKVSRQLDNVARLYRELQKLQDGKAPGVSWAVYQIKNALTVAICLLILGKASGPHCTLEM